MTEVPHEAAAIAMAAVIDTAAAIGTVVETATEEAAGTAARGATEVATGAGRQARTTGVAAAGAGAIGLGPGRTRHVSLPPCRKIRLGGCSFFLSRVRTLRAPLLSRCPGGRALMPVGAQT